MNPELRITRSILFSPLGKVGENRRCVKRGGLSVLLPSATTKSSKPAPRHSPPGALVQFLPCAEDGCPFSLVRGSLLWSRGTEQEPTLFASFGHTPKGAKTLYVRKLYSPPLNKNDELRAQDSIFFQFFRSFPPCCCWVWVTTGPTTRPVFDPRAREPVNPRLGLSSRRGSSALQCARPKDLTLS